MLHRVGGGIAFMAAWKASMSGFGDESHAVGPGRVAKVRTVMPIGPRIPHVCPTSASARRHRPRVARVCSHIARLPVPASARAGPNCLGDTTPRLVDVQLFEQRERLIHGLEEILVVLDHLAAHVDAEPLLVHEHLVAIEHVS